MPASFAVLYTMHLTHKIIVWDEAQTPKAINATGDNTDNDVTAEAAQFLLHRPKRQAVKVCVCHYNTYRMPFPGGGCLFFIFKALTLTKMSR